MERQRGELGPIAEALAELTGPVQALRKTSPPARRGFTVANQVDQLVSASEADPDRGFMARMMVLCSLPRSNPGNRLQYKRVNGPYTLHMIAGGSNKLPFGNFPRLILAWVSTEAVRTRNRVLILGPSLAEFMRALGISVPLDMNTLTALKRSSLGLDLYLWLGYRTFPLRTPLRISWRQVYRQFGAHPANASDRVTVRNFQRKVLRELKKIKLAWTGLNYATAPGVLILLPSTPAIPPLNQGQLAS